MLTKLKYISNISYHVSINYTLVKITLIFGYKDAGAGLRSCGSSDPQMNKGSMQSVDMFESNPLTFM